MLRFLFGLIACAFLTSASLAADVNIWLSAVGCPTEGPAMGCGDVPSSPPTTVPTITKPPGAQGTLYIWASPAAGETLQNWSLKVSSNPSLVSFNSSSVESYNPAMGSAGGASPTIPDVRWEFTDAPSNPQDLADLGVKGLNIFGVAREGLGIGPASAALDPFDYPANNAWLLASVNYSVLGSAGQSADIFLQIGDIGINHLGDTSAETWVVLGHNAPSERLNGEADRNENSATKDFTINIASTPAGDFDFDGDVDGRDFLAWQRNPGVGPLADWQANYGGQTLSDLSTVPEPGTGILMLAGGFALCTIRTKRGS